MSTAPSAAGTKPSDMTGGNGGGNGGNGGNGGGNGGGKGLLGPGGTEDAPQIPFLAEAGGLAIALAAIFGFGASLILVFYTWVENKPVSFEFQRYLALFFVIPIAVGPLLWYLYSDDLKRFEDYHSKQATGNAIGSALAKALEGDSRVSVLVRAMGMHDHMGGAATPLSEYDMASYRVGGFRTGKAAGGICYDPRTETYYPC